MKSFAVGIWLFTLPLLAAGAEPLSTATVGMSGTLADVVIPGPELEAKPIAGRADPVVVRLIRVDPHGTAKRYTIEWYGLEPGTFDLRNFLRRKDGHPLTAEVPSLLVRVDAVQPPGQVEPNALPATAPPAIGGYWTWVRLAAIVWVLGFAVIIASMVPKRVAQARAKLPPLSLADRLQPLVAGAVAGTLSAAELAALERALLALWRKRLRLEITDPVVALEQLHADPQAGPLLKQLEIWLHHPAATVPVDVAALLEPYRRISAADLPDEPAVARA